MHAGIFTNLGTNVLIPGGDIIFNGRNNIRIESNEKIDISFEDFSLVVSFIPDRIVKGDVHLLDKRFGSGAGRGYDLFIRNGYLSIALQGHNPNVHLESRGMIHVGIRNTATAIVNRHKGFVKIFLNGELVGQKQLVDFNLSNPGDLVVGSRFNDTGYFDGKICEIMIFDKAIR